MECIFSTSRRRGCFRCFRGRRLHLRDSRSGFFLLTRWARKKRASGGASLLSAARRSGAIAWWLDSLPTRLHLYAVYDFWHTQSEFSADPRGHLAGDSFSGYAWCRWGLGLRGFSPMIEHGQDFAAGLLGAHRICVRPAFDPAKGRNDDCAATLGIVVIFVAMMLLATFGMRNKAARQGNLDAGFREKRRSEASL